MASKRVTRKEVAALAGVSESVVSYVVNNYSYVSADKRARVEAAIRQLHYRPSAIGRALGRGITSHILFVVDHVLNENFSHMAGAIEQRAYQAGYMLSLCNARNDDDFVGMVNSRRFDGLIISSSLLSEQRIRSLAQYGTPVILLCARPYQMDLPNVLCVDTGIYTGTRRAIHYLVEQGRRNILYLDRTLAGDDEPGEDMKLRAYYDQLAEDGLPVLPSHVISGAATQQEQLGMLEGFLRSGQPVDAVFGRNDRFAVPAMHLLRAMGYRIPGTFR